jgi:hypothetical protein
MLKKLVFFGHEVSALDRALAGRAGVPSEVN